MYIRFIELKNITIKNNSNC